ncbi:MAG: Rpn family recombination-promoting nuclease/putative transposase [Planctomycetes bacterium]|nr:Rpn family recombination-promoting nuclease/putative transposase [Planctomycetota bacterium]
MERPPRTPHDRLFKAVFSTPSNAWVLLAAAGLPGRLVGAVRALRPAPGSAVGRGLTEVHRDLVFSARLGDGALRVVIEHLRREEPRAPLRALAYVVRELEAWRRGTPPSAPLPAVLAVVHQGRRPWQGARKLSRHFGVSPRLRRAIGPYLPAFEIALLDLAVTSIAHLERLSGPPLARIALVVMKLAADPRADLLAALDRLAALLRAAKRRPGGAEALGEVLGYALHVRRGLAPDMLAERLAIAVGRRATEEIMSATTREWMAEGARRVLERVLRSRFGEVPASVRERLEAASATALERWAERVLSAERLEDVFEAPAPARPKRSPRRKPHSAALPTKRKS